MDTLSFARLRSAGTNASWFLACAILLSCSPAIFAQDGGASPIVRIEEDWSLNVAAPQQGICAPQLTTMISPTADTNSYYAAFSINHRSQPEFDAGGLQLQLWNDDVPISLHNSTDNAMLNYYEDEELVTWTQVMAIEEGRLVFKVINGHSQTWGHFGGDDFAVSTPTTLTSLSQYLPSVSVNNSGISYAENRVHSLVIHRVRWITADGRITESENHFVVFPHYH